MSGAGLPLGTRLTKSDEHGLGNKEAELMCLFPAAGPEEQVAPGMVSKLPPRNVQIIRVGISWSAHLMKNKCLFPPGLALNEYVLLLVVTSMSCNMYLFIP